VCGGSASPLNAQLVGAQQLIMPAGEARRPDEIAGAKVFDSRDVERDQARPLRKFLVSPNFEAPTIDTQHSHIRYCSVGGIHRM
jgi:hypothetical protein